MYDPAAGITDLITEAPGPDDDLGRRRTGSSPWRDSHANRSRESYVHTKRVSFCAPQAKNLGAPEPPLSEAEMLLFLSMTLVGSHGTEQ